MNEFRGVNKHIDPTAARDLIDRWIERRTQVREAYAPSLLATSFKDYEVAKTPPFFAHHLIHGSNKEEAVFRVQGMLSSAALPPYEPQVKLGEIRSQSLRFIYQHVGIVGFDGELFNKQVEKIYDLHLRFHRSSSRLQMKPYTPPSLDDLVELVCKTRLFTTGRDAREFSPIPVPDLINSNGVMSLLCERTDVSFTEDNFVSYKALEYDEEDGGRRYVDISPDAFHLGDVVEMEFSAIAVPGSQGGMGGPKSHNFLLVLRGLTRLDETLSIQAAKMELSVASQRAPELSRPVNTIKRRIGYDREDEEMQEARKKVAMMQVNPAASQS